ncbi:MAG: hypothetical protein PUK04_03565, partial [Bacteroidales bacterium]|nr:hypothetical protein [Bacteroidales bacterium]
MNSTDVIDNTIAIGDLQKGTYKTFEYNLNNQPIEYITLEAKATSYVTSFQNVKVTQATYVESSANPVDCGTVAVEGSSTDTKFAVNWSNVNPLTLS